MLTHCRFHEMQNSKLTERPPPSCDKMASRRTPLVWILLPGYELPDFSLLSAEQVPAVMTPAVLLARARRDPLLHDVYYMGTERPKSLEGAHLVADDQDMWRFIGAASEIYLRLVEKKPAGGGGAAAAKPSSEKAVPAAATGASSKITGALLTLFPDLLHCVPGPLRLLHARQLI